jgi:GH35 family endo-1,4-beta-xylanase
MASEEWSSLDTGGALVVTPEGSETLRRARRNIEDLRKTDVLLRFVDREGKPLRRLPVEVTQVSSEFPVGDQTWHLDRLYRFDQGNTDRGVYWRRLFAECFTSATTLCYWTERPENDGPKTEDIQGRLRLDEFDAVARWAASEGLHVKGHPLFWSIDKCWPSWLSRYDIQTQMKFAEVRVRNLLARFGGMVRTWDVVNEALWEPAPANLSRRHWPHLEPVAVIADYVAEVLGWARSEAPTCTYVLNDYGLTQDAAGASIAAADGTEVTAAFQRRRLLEIVGELDRRGSIPDALGLQSHTGGLFSPETQWAVYEELAVAGIPLHITEFWAAADVVRAALKIAAQPAGDEEVVAATAEYVDRVMTVAYGHPSIEAFSFWGLMDSAISWDSRNSSHSAGPVYNRVRSIIRDRWRTRTRLETGDDGAIRFRGFPGAYEIVHPQVHGGDNAGTSIRVARAGGNEFTIRALRVRAREKGKLP